MTYRIMKFIQQHSLLGQFVNSRYHLIRQQRLRGKSASPSTERKEWTRNSNAYPSLWPKQLLLDARLLTRNIIETLHREVQADGRDFAILYVPRGTEELDGSLPVEDRWIGWLSEVCDELGIRLFDATPALRAGLEAVSAMYNDHWTPRGHEVVAEFLERELCVESSALNCARN